jgi:hypothetical protein
MTETNVRSGALLREVARMYTRAQRVVADCCRTTSTQCHLLTELDRAGPLSLSELGNRVSLEKSWVSRAVDAMVERGVVKKEPNPLDARTIEIRANAVIDATGTWGTPNPLGASGLPAIGEIEAQEHISYGIPDILGTERARFEGRRTLVVGAGHSAANALLDLADLAKQSPGTRLTWAVRSAALTRVFGGGAADALPARGQLGSSLRALRDSGAMAFVSGLRITGVERDAGQLKVTGLNPHGEIVTLSGIDQVICATGQRPDLSLTRELRIRLDPWLESTEALGPLIDPNLHSCGTVRPHGHRELAHPEPGLYTVGVKSYGRAPTFLMATGFAGPIVPIAPAPAGLIPSRTPPA